MRKRKTIFITVLLWFILFFVIRYFIDNFDLLSKITFITNLTGNDPKLLERIKEITSLILSGTISNLGNIIKIIEIRVACDNQQNMTKPFLRITILHISNARKNINAHNKPEIVLNAEGNGSFVYLKCIAENTGNGVITSISVNKQSITWNSALKNGDKAQFYFRINVLHRKSIEPFWFLLKFEDEKGTKHRILYHVFTNDKKIVMKERGRIG